MRLISLVVFALIPILVIGQNETTELDKKKQQLRKDIASKNELLDKTAEEKEKSLNQLVLLNTKISEREELIATINSEIELLDTKIKDNTELISSMKNDIKGLKDEYAKMIEFAYRNRSNYNKIMYVFASEDFNQAYRRVRHLQQYTSYRQRQAEAILHLEELLERKNEELQQEKSEKEGLLVNERKERKQLSSEKKEKQTIYSELKTKEKELKKEIKAKEKEQQSIQKAIEKIIAEEIKKAREAEGASADSWTLTPEAKALANSFTANKGKLPWPVERGVITSRFGVHSHPVLKQIKIRNNGVTISTSQESTARCVFDGVVSQVIVIPGNGKAVIVRHGDYLTVYSKLSEVYVQSGDKVSIKQVIGKVLTLDEKTELQFEIRKGMNAETHDPSTWLYRAN
jgi:septal ring factor EnvC (AmiA/AmiB activator)